MPFLSLKQGTLRKNIEHKLYLAQEKPDEYFDLSDCNLNAVPKGIYSVIKVLRKTHLLLQNNNLCDLDAGGSLKDLSGLFVLNLSCNRLKNLPQSFQQLTSLKILNLSCNRIRVFPEPLLHLTELISLNLENNRLESVPVSLGNLTKLKELYLNGNPLHNIPQSVSHILRSTQPTDSSTPPILTSSQPTISSKQESFSFVDSQMANSNPTVPTQSEEHAVSKCSKDRKEILARLAEEDARLSNELNTLQRKRDKERSDIISNIQTEESKSEQSIVDLLAKREALKYQQELRDQNNQDLLDKPDGTFRLRRDEILAAMRDMLEQTEEAYREHQTQRDAAIRHVIETEPQEQSAVQQVLLHHYRDQAERTSKLALAAESQKGAFAKLQAERDSRTRRLQNDVTLIEQQLCDLTKAEQKYRDERVGINVKCLLERRQELVQLLQRLKIQQEHRRRELQNSLDEMERRRSEDQRDYWLVQYQRVLDRKPPELCSDIDTDIYKILASIDALQFLPNFQYHNIDYKTLSSMSDADLEKLGIYSLGIRRSILNILEAKQKHTALQNAKGDEAPPSPSAPPLEPDAPKPIVPTAPPPDLIARFENECCVCQNAKCTVIFMQCGHVCTCSTCSQQLEICPLCRSQIVQRIQMQQ